MTTHEPTKACVLVHCHWHDVDEPGPGYLRCFECGHLYRTKGELRRRYRQELRNAYHDGPLERWDWLRLRWWLLTVRASRVTFCQECSHDF
jgi:hypothetical protein